MQSILSVLDSKDPAAGPAAGLSAFQTTVQSMALPIWGHVIFNGLGWLGGVLLGHPIIATFGFALTTAADAAFQAQIARWSDSDGPEDAEVLFPRLAWACAARAVVLLSTPTLIAVTGGVAEVFYFGCVACSMVTVAIANGLLSGKVFAAYTAPTLAALVAIVLAQLHGMAAAGAGVALISLAGLLAMIGACLQRVVLGWRDSHEASRALATELASAHAAAIVEKLAAEEAREEARRAHAAKANFLATMSHEIRTPMNGVLGMANLLMRGESDPKQKERIATLVQSGEYLLAILNDILDVSKIDAGKLELAERPEDLHAFLREVALFWEPSADEKGVQLRLEVGETVPSRVQMDALRVRQILFNLLGNALKFTETGEVAIRVEARDIGAERALIHMAVSDTGPGIDPNHIASLFAQFAQGDVSSIRRFGGTGLGLSIARQLVELMGGRIWVESALGRGADFHVEIPLALVSKDAVATTADTREGAFEIQPLDLLIVDDNAVNLMVLSQILSVFDHRLTRASDGEQALAQLAERPFDLVLMDVRMPGMTGIEALRRLRAVKGPNRATPVIALTADVASGDDGAYPAMGFAAHCTKPIQVAQLLNAITAATAETDTTATASKAIVGA